MSKAKAEMSGKSFNPNKNAHVTNAHLLYMYHIYAPTAGFSLHWLPVLGLTVMLHSHITVFLLV